nr:dihydrodipicolinate reductase C-terminal domain-containing protein [Leptospira santarosai]
MGEISDIEIQDIHHRHKKDAPSGTAEKLKNILLETLGRTSRDEKRDSEREGPQGNRNPHVPSRRSDRRSHGLFLYSRRKDRITHKAQDRNLCGFACGGSLAEDCNLQIVFIKNISFPAR